MTQQPLARMLLLIHREAIPEFSIINSQLLIISEKRGDKVIKKPDSNKARVKRHQRIRNKIEGTQERPRLNVFRSSKHIYAQIIDDVSGVTLTSASSLAKGFECSGGNKDAARKVGETIAKNALDKGISEVVFDRGGYIFHGRVKELAEAAREGGLKF